VLAGSLLTITYGVMQMIVAVVVEAFADMRKGDTAGMVTEMNEEEVAEKRTLARIFQKIDKDQSGSVSYDELERGARRVSSFKNWLRVMDVDANDLKKLFEIIDEDGSGEIDPEEFIEFLYRIKNAESTTTTKFVKHMVEGLDKKNVELMQKMSQLDSMHDTLTMLNGLMAELSQHRPWPSYDLPPLLANGLPSVPDGGVADCAMHSCFRASIGPPSAALETARPGSTAAENSPSFASPAETFSEKPEEPPEASQGSLLADHSTPPWSPKDGQQLDGLPHPGKGITAVDDSEPPAIRSSFQQPVRPSQ